MNTYYLRMARRAFRSPTADAATQRSNMRKWARCIRQLGPRWLGLPMNKETTAC